MSMVEPASELKTRTYHRAQDDDGTPSHWETDVWCTDGRVVIGQDVNKEESKRIALERAAEHHAFLAADPRVRLKAVLARAPGTEYLLAADVTYAIKAIAEIILGEKM